MAFRRKRGLPKKREPTIRSRPGASGKDVPVLEALEKREAQVREVLEFLDGKRTLQSLGLALDDLRAFVALREALGPDWLQHLGPLLRAMEPGTAKELPAILALGLKADEAAAIRGMAQVLRGAGVPAGDLAAHLEAAAELARRGFGAGVVKAVGKEVERLHRSGISPERIAGTIAAYAQQEAGAEGALVDAIRKQKEAEAALAALEEKARASAREAESLAGSAEEVHRTLLALRREVVALRQQKDFLEAEVKGLGRARGAPWAEVLGRVRAGLEHLRKEHEKGRDALEDLRKEMERLQEERTQTAAKPAEGAPPSEGAPPAGGARYSRLMQRLQQVAISPAPAPGAPPPVAPTEAPFDRVLAEAAIREVMEGLASLKADADTMARKQEALEAEIRKRESELRAAATLWALLAGKGDADLRTAAENIARAAGEGREAPIPPEFAEKLREGARRLLQAETVPVERLQEVERELEDVRRLLESSVPRSRFEALSKECDDLRKRLTEAVPRWRVEAQEHELKFLKKVAFEKVR